MSPKRFCKQFERSILTRVRVKSTRHCSVAFKEKTETIQMVDRLNTTPIFIKIGQDRETLTFKALLYLNVAVHAQVCRLFSVGSGKIMVSIL